jgi:hypothetical protein
MLQAGVLAGRSHTVKINGEFRETTTDTLL